MPVTKSTTPRKAAKKAAARPRAAAPALSGPIVVPTDEIPAELRDFYSSGPPRLGRARGAGTTGDGGYTPLELTTPTAAERKAVPLEPLFYLDGVEYGIPKEFPPALALLYLDGLDEGRDIAIARVLKVAVGTAGWSALMQYVRAGGAVGEEALAAMLEHVLKKVLGIIEASGEGNG